MPKRWFEIGTIACGLVLSLLGFSVAGIAQQQVIPVWPGVAPGSENWTQREISYGNAIMGQMVRNVVRPTLAAYFPEKAKANGTAVIICPGGAFRFLSWQSEGTQVAEWLAERGVAAFVLKYRLMDTGPTEETLRQSMEELYRSLSKNPIRSGAPEEWRGIVALASADGRQAIKVVREHAGQWGINPERIGIMGFSAGGMTTMGVVMNHDADSRPNFAAPIYGGGTDGAKIPEDAPPLFILAASDDPISASSLQLYSDWKAAGRTAELHIYAKGGHGFGMRKRGLPVDHWIDRLGDWLAAQGFLNPPAPPPSAKN